MFAAAFAAIPSFKVVFFCENDIALRAIVKIFRVQGFVEHEAQS
jgi:hypothetical protein